MITANKNFIGWTLILSAIMWVLQMTFVSLFYAQSISIFGTLSDLTNIFTMIFLIPFTTLLYKKVSQYKPLLGKISLVLGIIGIFSVSIASLLLISNYIGFIQSLPPIFIGYVAYGISLLIYLSVLKNKQIFTKPILIWGFLVGLGLVSIIGLLTVNLGKLFSFNIDGLWSNPLIYPAFLLTPFFFIGFPFWVFSVGKGILNGSIDFN